jgi:hypothetical protein
VCTCENLDIARELLPEDVLRKCTIQDHYRARRSLNQVARHLNDEDVAFAAFEVYARGDRHIWMLYLGDLR